MPDAVNGYCLASTARSVAVATKMSVATDKIKPTKEMENKMAKAKSGLNAVQAIRYRELMWIAQFGDFMSQTEFEELSKLMKLRNYK